MTASPSSHRLPILLAATGRPYEEALLATFDRPGGRLHVARRCVDLVDLLSASSTRVARVAVVWSGLPRLDRDAFARLAAHGVAVVMVVDADSEPQTAERLTDMGAAATVPVPASLDAVTTTRFAGSLAAQVLAVAALRPGDGERGVHEATADEPTGDESPGRLVAVWGPVGAPGRSTVAVSVADELARLGLPTLLADADTYGPSLAQRLGVLDEASGMAAAARAANAGTLDDATLSGAARALPSGLRLLTGLTRAERWPELPAAAMARVWRQARSEPGCTVVDCGFCIEEDDELSYDSVHARRNAATLTALAAADVLVVVGSADPVGLTRLLRGLHELADLAQRRADAVPTRRYVVVTRVRTGPGGRHRPGRQIVGLLALRPDQPAPVLVPDDPTAFDRAVAAGRTLAEVAPKSPARAPLLALARTLAADTQPEDAHCSA